MTDETSDAFLKVIGNFISFFVTFKNKGKKLEIIDAMVSEISAMELSPPDCTRFKCLYFLGLLFFLLVGQAVLLKMGTNHLFYLGKTSTLSAYRLALHTSCYRQTELSLNIHSPLLMRSVLFG
jgi:hypothetical protein